MKRQAGIGWIVAVVLCLVVLASARPAASQQARASAQSALDGARAAKRQADDLTRHADYGLVMERRSVLAEKMASGERFLGFAQGAFERATTDRNYADAATLANKATEHYDDFVRAVRGEIATIERERNPPPPPEPRPPPPPVPEPEPDPAPTAEPAAEQPDDAEPATQPDAAGEPGDGSAGSRADAGGATTPPPTVPPPPSTMPTQSQRTPPKALRDAAQAFLGGDYQRAVDLLASKSYGDRKTQAQLLLLRAAARYNLFLIGGGTEYPLRFQTIEDVKACRQADPNLEPAPEIFSPRFRDLFSGIR